MTFKELLDTAYTLIARDAVVWRDLETDVYTLNLNAKVYFKNALAHEESGPIFDSINTILVTKEKELFFFFETASSCCGIPDHNNVRVRSPEKKPEVRLHNRLPKKLNVVLFGDMKHVH